MSIITDTQLGFEDKINIENNKNKSKGKRITYDMINDLHGSPAIKRGIWRQFR